MSLPAALRPAARSAYRDVLRAARVTFERDPARHAQFVGAIRPTFLSPTLTNPSKPQVQPLEGPPVDFDAPEEIQKRINEWKEVAEFLRKNVVQGRLQENGSYGESLSPRDGGGRTGRREWERESGEGRRRAVLILLARHYEGSLDVYRSVADGGRKRLRTQRPSVTPSSFPVFPVSFPAAYRPASR